MCALLSPAVSLGVLCLLFSSLLSSHRASADDPPRYSDEIVAKAERILEENGLRRAGTRIQPVIQDEFNRQVSEEVKLRRALKQIRQDWEQADTTARNAVQVCEQVETQLGALNARYAVVGNADGRNNDLVATINAMSAQLKQLNKARDAAKEEARRERAKLGSEEEKYAEHVLRMRRQVEALKKCYEDAVQVKDVGIALQVLATRYETPLELDIEMLIAPHDRRVQKLEESVFSEAIDLEQEGGGLIVSAMVGLEPVRMLVDSGASVVLLPQVIAEKAGIEPTADAKDLTMVMADGRRIQVKEVFIPRLRVGQFEAENIRAALLDERVPLARPLLGLSFLEKFKFEIDTAGRKLKMLRISTEAE